MRTREQLETFLGRKVTNEEWEESQSTYERIDNRKLEYWSEPSWKKNKVKCTVEFLEDQGRSDRDKQLHNL